jgi:hypothetical protein
MVFIIFLPVVDRITQKIPLCYEFTENRHTRFRGNDEKTTVALLRETIAFHCSSDRDTSVPPVSETFFRRFRGLFTDRLTIAASPSRSLKLSRLPLPSMASTSPVSLRGSSVSTL